MEVQQIEGRYQHQMVEANRHLTEVMMKDVFTPPVASRIYAYSNIAAYETLKFQDDSFISLSGQLRNLKELPKPEADKDYSFLLASQAAFTKVAISMVYTDEMMEDYLHKFSRELKKSGLKRNVINNSMEFGEEMADEILSWMEGDGYFSIRGKRHSLSSELGRWQPTPPDFMDGIEPFWGTVRPFTLDSASQFAPPPPPRFDTLPDSEFYKQSYKVYKAVLEMDEEKKAIARFWDCNPNITFIRGHVKYFKQQLSPGGHWVSIACIASAEKGLPILQQAAAISLTSIALADAFISCWDTKYKVDLIRPETYINQYIDPDWVPFLQTPAFPEYSSGHSVISNAAAEALTHLFGDSFAYTDTSEVSFGLPERDYGSFREASAEAAISRLYGGIHYPVAIENGILQGKGVGTWVANSVKFTNEEPLAFY